MIEMQEFTVLVRFLLLAIILTVCWLVNAFIQVRTQLFVTVAVRTSDWEWEVMGEVVG